MRIPITQKKKVKIGERELVYKNKDGSFSYEMAWGKSKKKFFLKKCSFCGAKCLKEEYFVKRNKDFYCDVTCKKSHTNKKERKCFYCKKSFLVFPSTEKASGRRGIGKFCSMKCKGKNMSKEQTGQIYSEERGKNISKALNKGLTKRHFLVRSSKKYKDWRKSIFERDNYTCRSCGIRGKQELSVDHIFPFCDFDELRFDMRNGRVLCRKCHKKTDTFAMNSLNLTEDKRKNLVWAIVKIWESLESHLQDTYEPVYNELKNKVAKESVGDRNFHRKCVKEYASVIKVLSDFI